MNPTRRRWRILLLSILLAPLAAAAPPLPPMELEATREGDDVLLTWTASPSEEPVDGYHVYRSLNGSAFERIGSTTGNWFLDEGVLSADPNATMPVVSILYTVTSFAGNVESSPSAPVAMGSYPYCYPVETNPPSLHEEPQGCILPLPSIGAVQSKTVVGPVQTGSSMSRV